VLSEVNEALIREYLDIAVNDSEDLERFAGLLTDDCVWYITPPGHSFVGGEQVTSFSRFAMGSRTHSPDSKVEIRTWFADGDDFCVEYFHAAHVTPLRIRVVETVCLVCHMRDGQFDSVHEYVDASRSFLIRLGLSLLPLIVRLRSRKPA
jgi:ketosteroid isomerase-like protein